jgi:hypothetical protein
MSTLRKNHITPPPMLRFSAWITAMVVVGVIMAPLTLAAARIFA